jgi:hypothetical protein
MESVGPFGGRPVVPHFHDFADQTENYPASTVFLWKKRPTGPTIDYPIMEGDSK